MSQFRVLRTSSFRLALMYATFTGITFVILLGVIYLSTTRFMRHQIDDSVANEIDEIITDSRGRDLGALKPSVEAMSKHASGFYYLLQDSTGNVVAGNLPSIDPAPGVREWDKSKAAPRAAFSQIRGRGMLMPDAYLFVGWSTHQLLEMEEMVVGTFAWGLAASIALALAGGLFAGRRLMGRIETVSNTSRSIIGEDLTQRLPVSRVGDELDHLATSINAMLDRIEGLMVNLRQVTSDIAHDLRTPLTRLRQRMELAVRPDADPGLARATLENAVGEIDAILAIFGALLRIAQIESASATSFKTLSLSELLGTIAELYLPMAEENGQALNQAIPANLTVNGDRELLMQLFANLIENALRHSPRGSSITLAAARIEDRVVVKVIDDGPGIPQSMHGKVLQRFFRLEASRTTPGNGLGLSLVDAIAKMHDAKLELSDAAPGLCVSVALPG
jgi:signal transduction histidine kinase